MLFNRDLKRTAAIRVRPFQDGMVLYFPYGFDKGGPGFLVPEAQGNALRYREWSPFHFICVPTMLGMFLLGLVSGAATWGYVGGALAGLLLGELFRRWQERIFRRMIGGFAPAPYRLSKERYWQELAMQHSRVALGVGVLFTGGLVMAVGLSFWQSLGQLFGSGMLVALHLAAGVMAVMQTRKMIRLLQGRVQARRNKVVPGSVAGLAAA
jgi:hypothetical protein